MAILLEEQEYAPIPLAEFCRYLNYNDLSIAGGQYEWIIAILGSYFPQGIKVCKNSIALEADPACIEQFLQLLCPLIAKNSEEQQKFFNVGLMFFENNLFEKYQVCQSKVDECEEKQKNKRKLLKNVKNFILIIASAILLILFAWLAFYLCHNTNHVTTQILTVKKDSPIIVNQSKTIVSKVDTRRLIYEKPTRKINFTVASLLFIGGISIGFIVLTATQKKTPEVRKSKNPPYFFFIPEKDHLIERSRAMYVWAKTLSKHKEGLQTTFDIKPSIKTTIKNGGYSTIILKPSLERPKYLFFIDFDYYDQQAYIFKFLSGFFAVEAVELELFYYRSDPRICWNIKYSQGITLTDLSIIYSARSIVMFTDGNGLVDIRPGKIYSWVSDYFAHWEKKVLLSPVPTKCWGIVESALSVVFNVLPADFEGLTQMTEYFNFQEQPILVSALQSLSEYEGSKDNFSSLYNLTAELVTVKDIQHFFSARVSTDNQELILQWAYATALYPSPSWEITLLIGNAIQKIFVSKSLVTLPNLLLITSLPWLKVNHIPVLLRKSLLEELQPVFQNKVTYAIVDALNCKEITGTNEESAADIERKIRTLELLSLLPTKSKAAAGKKDLLPFYQADMIKDPLVKEILDKSIKMGVLQGALLLASILVLAYWIASPLLVTRILNPSLSAPIDTISLNEGNFHTAWSRSAKYPVKVYWSLTKANLDCLTPLNRCNCFSYDPQLPDDTKLNLDYERSGYDQGHNFDSDDGACSTQQINIHCWYFTNIAPQIPNLNRITWKDLEDQCRKWAEGGDDLFIECGSFGKAKTIGPNKVWVPEYCWKIVKHKNGKIDSYLMPNAVNVNQHPFSYYHIDIDAIRQKTGINSL